MRNHIHVDEKWSYLKEPKTKPLLELGEKQSYRCAQSKRYVPKVMFVASIARPWFDEEGGALFDGKIRVHDFDEPQENIERK